MTISYNSNVPKEFQEELNENLRNIESEVGSFSILAQSYEESFETQRLCITTLNNLVEQQQKEIEELKQDSQTHFDALVQQKAAIDDLQSQIVSLTANLLETVKSLTVFVKAVEMRLQSIEEKLTYDQETIAHLSSKVVELELVCQKVVASDLFK